MVVSSIDLPVEIESQSSSDQLDLRSQSWQRFFRVDSVFASVLVSLVVFGLFAVQGILLARMLGKDGRGQFATAVLYPQSILYLGLLGAPELFAGLAAKGGNIAKLRRSALRYGLVAGAISMLVSLILYAVAIPREKQTHFGLACIASLAFALQQIRLTIQSIDHGMRAMSRYNIARLLAALSFPSLIVLFWLSGLSDLKSACVALLASSAASLLLCQWGMNESWIGEQEISVAQGMSQAKHLMGAWLVTEILEKLDLCLMVWLFSDSMVGAYSASVPMAGMMIIVPNALGLYAFNRGARDEERPSANELLQLFAGLVAFQIAAGIVLGLILPFAIPLLYTESFRDAIPFALLLIPAAGIRGILQAMDAYLRGRKILAPTIIARVLGIAVMLLIAFAAKSTLGVYSVPIAYDIAQVLVLGILFVVILKDARRGNAIHMNRNASDERVPSSERDDSLSQLDSQRLEANTTLLINYITKHQLPVFEELRRRVPNLKVLISVEMEPQRDYKAEFGSLSVEVQRNITLKKKWNHESGFEDQLNVQVPYDTLWRLLWDRPKIVVSYELGVRSLFSAIYRKINRKSRLILCINVSEHTEKSWGRLRSWLRPWLLRTADAVTYNGPSCKRYLESIGTDSRKLHHFPYAAHPDNVHKGTTHRSREDRYRLLYVGQLTDRKNPILMLEQLSRWATSNPDRTVMLTLVGRGPLLDTIQATQRPANFQIEFLGSVNPDDMPGVWSRHGGMIFPTLADEWGMVTNESMHSGVPVLGSLYAQSTLALLKDNANGWVFHPDNAEEMYSAIDRFFSTPYEALEEISENVRRDAAERTPEYSARLLAQTIQSLSSN